jgi:hypothetical protein
LATLQGDELKALQEKLNGSLARTSGVFGAAETGQLDNLTKAMRDAATVVADTMKRPDARK